MNQVIKKYEKGQLDLENVLNKQRYYNDKCGLGYSKFHKPSTSQIIFVNSSNKFNNEESKKMQVVIHHKNAYVKNNSYVSKYKNFFKPTYFYCNTKGHTLNVCYIRNSYISNGKCVWVRKGTNPKGPNEYWVLRNYY